MALTPDEARRPTQLDIDEVARLEKIIDKEIAGKLEGNEISVSLNYIYRNPVKEGLRKLYLSRGWKRVDVKNHTDQRDGDWAVVTLGC
jgi:hypothetical protein